MIDTMMIQRDTFPCFLLVSLQSFEIRGHITSSEPTYTISGFVVRDRYGLVDDIYLDIDKKHFPAYTIVWDCKLKKPPQ